MPAQLGSFPRVSRRRTAQPEGMTELIWSFAPWLTFLLATRVTSFYAAVVVGVVAAVVVVIRAVRRHRLHLLDVAGLVYFAGLGVILLAVHPAHVDTWARYAQAGSHTALTLIVFGSILVGHPFTEAYARERTPEALWSTAGFHAVNRRISAVWGLAFLVGTFSLILAGAVGSTPVLLRVIIPFGALVAAFKYTQSQSQTQGQGPADPAGQGPAPSASRALTTRATQVRSPAGNHTEGR
jgi:hypothetical protein